MLTRLHCSTESDAINLVLSWDCGFLASGNKTRPDSPENAVLLLIFEEKILKMGVNVAADGVHFPRPEFRKCENPLSSRTQNPMAKRRGNPNWGKPEPIGPVVPTVTSFEQIVKEFKLPPDQYIRSTRLREWARRNKNSKYIPEALLEAWGFEIESTL
jgi:hypothetical protein